MTGPVGVADAEDVELVVLALRLPKALDELELVDWEVVPLVDDTVDDVLLPDAEDDELDEDPELDAVLWDVVTEVDTVEDTVLELTVVDGAADEDDELDPGTVPSAGPGTYVVRS